MRNCAVCTHENRNEIERRIARGDSYRDIAGQFQLSKSSVHRHTQCITEALIQAREDQLVDTARDVNAEIEKVFSRVNKMMAACDKWLTDPENPDEYTLEPRAGEINVVYETGTGGKAKEKLSVLLKQIADEGHWGRRLYGEAKTSDPRKLILDAARELNDACDRLAKLTGAYQKKQENEQDRKRRRDVMTMAAFLLARKRGDQKSFVEIARLMDSELFEMNQFVAEAEQRIRSGDYS